MNNIKIKHLAAAGFIAAAELLLNSLAYAEDQTGIPVLHIQADQVVATVSPTFSGMMTEEINHSYDGGLYAELIQNRVFKDDARQPVHWSLIQSEGAEARMALDPSNGLNQELPVSLRLEVTKVSADHPAGVANDGYWGIPVKPHTRYRASFYAKAGPGFTGSVRVCLENPDGMKIFAKATVKRLTGDWEKYTVDLETSYFLKPTTQAHFLLALDSPGTVWFDLVSLFPPTWNDRPNGNRPDLMQMLDNMKPAFLRFPGGNYLEGSTLATRFPWKDTLGDLSQRPGHQGCWGYRSSDGLGLLEFLEWAEDLQAEPVLAIYAGYSLPPKNDVVRAGPKLAPYVTDALDEIEYVIGATNTPWGARRAADGHPAPFDLHYVEIGNEDWFDPTGSYDARFTQFYDAIKAKYPQLLCISTVGTERATKTQVHSRTPDLVDEHYYWKAEDFEKSAPTRFDNYPRTGPKIFVGEWAAYEDIVPWDQKSENLPPTPAFKAALGDAALLTAMERNADIITMQCYAPMLVNVNPGARQWRPNLIGYDALESFGSPSYYTIKMFNENRGDVLVKSTLAGAEKVLPLPLNYSVTKDREKGIIYLKVVNANSKSQMLKIDLEGVSRVKSRGTCLILKSDELEAGNSLAEPTHIVPVTEKIAGLARSFNETLAPESIEVFKIQTK